MNKSILLTRTGFIAALMFCVLISNGQDTARKERIVYKLKPKIDVPIVVGCAAWCGFTLTQIYTKGPSTQEQILNLSTNNIAPLDRWAVTPYNHKVDRLSYYPFYSSIPLPLAFALTGKHMRKDFLKIGFLYMEALAVDGLLGSSATYFVNQYRPYAYSSGTSMDQRMIQNAKNSFYAGHVEVIACSSFFIAQVYAGYYPDSKIKWLFFALAGVATAGMGYMRIDAGMHFPSDVILGAGTGAASGMLVPYFHNHRILKNTGLSFNPYSTGTAQGLTMTYAFNK